MAVAVAEASSSVSDPDSLNPDPDPDPAKNLNPDPGKFVTPTKNFMNFFFTHGFSSGHVNIFKCYTFVDHSLGIGTDIILILKFSEAKSTVYKIYSSYCVVQKFQIQIFLFFFSGTSETFFPSDNSPYLTLTLPS